MKTILKKSLALLLLCAGVAANAKVELPGLVSDGMVLQRESTVNIWGKAKSGKTVKVTTSWDGKKYKAVADNDGNWNVKAQTGMAGGPYSISISDGEETVINDVLVGEVWLCSGQSNMEMPMMGFPSQPNETVIEDLIDAGKHKQVRFFRVEKYTMIKKVEEEKMGVWEHCTASNASKASAIGYYYATQMSDILGMPFGLIDVSWGGTRIEAWMSLETAKKVNPDIESTDVNRADTDANRTSVLWERLIKPCDKYTLRGFLWYQGESNKGHHYEYHEMMKEMVALWRDRWNANGAAAPACNPALEGLSNGEQMPFLFAQFAPFDYNNPYDWNGRKNDILLPLMWESQMKAAKIIPNSDIAVNADLGSYNYIHPAYKKKLGQRFILLGLHHAYGELNASIYGTTLDWRGPEYKSVRFENGKAIVDFETNSTLYPANVMGITPILGFEIAGEDRVFHKADAVCVHQMYAFSRSVEVSCPEVPNPVAVRYAFKNLPGELNLTNTFGLPAFPFRTDNWDDVE